MFSTLSGIVLACLVKKRRIKMKKLTSKEMRKVKGGAWYDGTCHRRAENILAALHNLYERNNYVNGMKFIFHSMMATGC